jgi:hypothetical protein
MWKFFKGRGLKFRDASYGPQYLGAFPDQPFPLNPLFRSEPVLDDAARELIYAKVIDEGSPLKAVSAELGVDVRRVAAVVRLKEVEREWKTQVSRVNMMASFFLLSVLSLILCAAYMMILLQNFRLVLKTPTWLKTIIF